MEYSYQILEESFKKLPPQMQEVLTSPQTMGILKEVGDKNGLLIDQQSELFDLTSHIILGLVSAGDFVKLLSKNAGVTDLVAKNIAKDISDKIFRELRLSLIQKEDANTTGNNPNYEDTNDSMSSTLQTVGNITIEKPEPESENQVVTPADRGNILAGLENPPSSAPHTNQPPQNLPVGEEEAGPFSEMDSAKSPIQKENHTEPLVDFLLSKPAGQSVQNVVATPTTVQKPKITVPPLKSSGGPDPYRELIK